MAGYNEEFLATKIATPRFSMRLEGKVLEKSELRDGRYRDYINYSVAMHREHRSPIFAALNIDQRKLIPVKRGGWNIDDLIGRENQLDNDYYRANRWDRGHVARRSSTAWGEDKRAAKAASDSTMFYSNACLQFDSFNQDEWLDLENWVKGLKQDIDDKITVFSGPVYGDEPLYVAPRERRPAEVPSAFFKIVCFINSQSKLEVRAFLVPQDEKAMADWQGRRRVNHQFYQTTVAEIEHLTGIVFDAKVAKENPLYFYENPTKRDELAIDAFPENIPVDHPADMRGFTDRRQRRVDCTVDVFIAGALPDPKGRDRSGEWVSLLNLQAQSVDLSGWSLEDGGGARVALEGRLRPGQSKVIKGEALAPLTLGNSGDILTLLDQQDQRVDRVRYRAHEVRPGKGLLFRRPEVSEELHREAEAPRGL